MDEKKRGRRRNGGKALGPALTGLALGVGLLTGCTWSSLVEHGNVAFDVSPDGQRIVFSAADGDLYLFDLATHAVQPLTHTPETKSSPTFSPNGQWIAYAGKDDTGRGGRSALFVRSLDGKTVRRLTSSPDASDYSPSFSADGKRILFVRAYRNRRYSMGGWTWDNMDICVIGADGKDEKRLTQKTYYFAARPLFLAGGRESLYSAAAQGVEGTLLTLEMDAQPPVPKNILGSPPPNYPGGSWGGDPALSRDGKKVAFISDRAHPFQYDIWITTPNGDSPRPIGVTTVSPYNQNPAFLPDGRHLLYLAGTAQNAGSRYLFSLYEADSEGKTPPRQIADSGLFTDPLHWKHGATPTP